MRQPKYLSPTSVSLFHLDRTEFYLKYMAENRPPRLPQTEPMSVGSAFDAFVKNYLVYSLHGEVAPEYEIEAIFESQVEPHNRDFALEAGEFCFDRYKESGALADLMAELAQASDEPRFEFSVEGRISHEKFVDGIPLLGKPDVYFIKSDGARMVYDWKVNGYCSRGKMSPKKGYSMVRDGWGDKYPHSRNHRTPHKDAMLVNAGGIVFNCSHTLEEIDENWARQLAIYLWLLGEPVGTDAIAGIDQLACGEYADGYPMIRVGTIRVRINPEYQVELMQQIAGVWEAVTTRHIFTDMTPEQNLARCKLLDETFKAYEAPKGSNLAHEEWYRQTMRQHR